jgi:hypothetical protein
VRRPSHRHDTARGKPAGLSFASTSQSRYQFSPGAYTVEGTLDPVQGTLVLQPVRWLQRPAGWIAVCLHGSSAEGGRTFSGQMMNKACAGFRISHVQ